MKELITLNRYEYTEKDGNGKDYTCSFTIKSGVRNPIAKAHYVETFTIKR